MAVLFVNWMQLVRIYKKMVFMNSSFTVSDIHKHEVVHLYGLENEYTKILNFCRFVWSDTWVSKKNLYRFNPSILLYGSPGTGKTTLLKNIATNLIDDDFKYLSLSLELLLDKDLGMSSKHLKSFFEEIENLALQDHKVFVHFDDVDSVLCSRYISNESSGVKRFVNTFIKEIDKLQSLDSDFIPIIATTTNMYAMIDTAVKRRFSLKFEIENNVSLSEFKDWIQPIILDLGIDNDLDYLMLYNQMNKNKLTNYDVYLILQNLFLDKLSGIKICKNELELRFRDAESSNIDKHMNSL